MNDLRYVNAGEEFDEEDFSWRYIDDFENRDIIEKVFETCGGRKYFKAKKEANKWRRIDRQLSRGAIRKEWIENCIEWAETKNAVICAIKVDALGSLVLNKPAMQDWLLENKRNLVRPEDFIRKNR